MVHARWTVLFLHSQGQKYKHWQDKGQSGFRRSFVSLTSSLVLHSNKKLKEKISSIVLYSQCLLSWTLSSMSELWLQITFWLCVLTNIRVNAVLSPPLWGSGIVCTEVCVFLITMSLWHCLHNFAPQLLQRFLLILSVRGLAASPPSHTSSIQQHLSLQFLLLLYY